jgi:two-component system, NtrC family, response regulator PilR
MAEKDLLIADDDETLLFAFRKVFDRTGLRIDTADSLREARLMLIQNAYRLLITDLRFKETEEEEGIEIARYAKQRYPNIKVLLWTAFGDGSTAKKAVGVECDFYLTKPASLESIRAIMIGLGLL